MKQWTDLEEKFVIDNIHLETKDIFRLFCDKFGTERSYDSVQKKVKYFRDGIKETDNEYVTANFNNHTDSLIDSSSIERNSLYEEETLSREGIRKELQKWIDELCLLANNKNLTPQTIPPTNLDHNALCLVISDTHVGKLTSRFNLKVFEQRLLSLPKYLFERFSDNLSLDEIHIMLLGDIIEGEEIYPTQSSHIECTIMDQIKIAVNVLWEMIIHIAKFFPHCNVVVHSVPGNHGRVSKTANEKSNFDNIVYMMISNVLESSRLLEEDLNIFFEPNYNNFLNINVKNHSIVLNHNGVKHTGTPATRVKIAGWTKPYNATVFVNAHWHEPKISVPLGITVISNGCLCGADDLTQRMGEVSTPSQSWFIIEPNCKHIEVEGRKYWDD